MKISVVVGSEREVAADISRIVDFFFFVFVWSFSLTILFVVENHSSPEPPSESVC